MNALKSSFLQLYIPSIRQASKRLGGKKSLHESHPGGEKIPLTKYRILRVGTTTKKANNQQPQLSSHNQKKKKRETKDNHGRKL